MRRIFGAHAYGPGPAALCGWAADVPDSALRTPALSSDMTTDIAIIGAGYTGLTAALHLAKAGLGVVVLDEHFPGHGASGRNGGFCCLGGARLSSQAIRTRHGTEGLTEWRQAERTAIDHVVDFLADHDIDAQTHSNGETILAHSPRAFRDLVEHSSEVEAEYGLRPTLHTPEDLDSLGMAGPWHGGLTIPLGFGLNPRRYIQGLSNAAQAAGVRVFSATPVTKLAPGTPHRLYTPQGTVTAKRLIVATNGYSSEDLPNWLGARFMPAQSNVLLTRPLTKAEQAEAGWTSAQMAYDSRGLLHYFRLLPDGRFLFGMRGGLLSSRRADEGMAKATRQHFDRLFPAWSHVESPWNWSGMVSLAAHGAPFAGPVPDLPNTWAALSYHGNGVAMGSFAGKLLADLVSGQNPALYPRLMKEPPPRIPLGRFRRVAMPFAYASRALADLR